MMESNPMMKVMMSNPETLKMIISKHQIQCRSRDHEDDEANEKEWRRIGCWWVGRIGRNPRFRGIRWREHSVYTRISEPNEWIWLARNDAKSSESNKPNFSVPSTPTTPFSKFWNGNGNESSFWWIQSVYGCGPESGRRESVSESKSNS